MTSRQSGTRTRDVGSLGARHNATTSREHEPAPQDRASGLQALAGNRAFGQLLSARASSGLGTPAAPLAHEVRVAMEARFGHDFGSVRVHGDAAAADAAAGIHARAYTVGEDIVFGASAYAPETSAGRQLLAHELAHVIQQRRGGSPAPQLPGAHGAALEADADQAAAVATRGGAAADVKGASAPGLAMQAAESWSDWARRKLTEWRDWATTPASAKPASKPWIDRKYAPPAALPPGAVPINNGDYHVVPTEARAADPLDSPVRRAQSQAMRRPQPAAPAPPVNVDPDATQIMTRAQRERLALNAQIANQPWPEDAPPQRRWVRRGRSLRRGSASVGGLVFIAVAMGSSLYFLSQSQDPLDFIERAGDLAGEALVGAAIFRLMGPAGAFLGLSGDNPEIQRNRDTMDFIHANFSHYFESDRATGKENYTGPGDFMTLFHEAYDLLHNTDALELSVPEPTRSPADE